MWLDLSPEEQLEVLTNVSQQTNLSPNAIEKDWWVTMALKALFQCDCSHLMVFKGGTSLSKAWHLIERFSEDIDIAIDRSFFGFEDDLNRKAITNLRRASCLYVNTTLKEQLDSNLQAMGITGYTLIIQELKDSTQDPQTIELNYNSLLEDNAYIKERVLIEVGARSLIEPSQDIEMRSMIADAYPTLAFADAYVKIPTVMPQRTFLEKAFLLHEEFQKPSENIRVERMSRHIYDLEKLMDTDFAQLALADTILYKSIVDHRRKLTAISGIDYSTHNPKAISFTDALQSGENKLSVKVRSESLADMLGSLTQYAAHQIGGITRKVTLFAVPDVHISDLRIETTFDKDYKDAELKAFVSVTNTTKSIKKDVSLRLTIDNLPVLMSAKLPDLEPSQTWSGWVSGQVKNPLKWDTEHPNLYTVKIDLNSAGKVTEQVEKRIGFREIVVDGNLLLVNGKAVKLRGVCRHEVHPLTGRVLTAELQRKDVELYREANCNFIRTSHYPPGEEFLDICDELGMFVEVEAPVCWLGHHANENWKTLDYRDPQYYGYVLQANMETIHFYRNHPSILFWSMANESYWNKEFAQIAEYVKKADTSRPFAFHDQGYGGFNNQGSTGSISNIHYPGPNGHIQAEKSDRPMVFGEYCHLNVYNRSELVTDPGVRIDWGLALQQVWENMYKTPAVLGGSIWSGIDDIFQLPNGDAVGYGAWGPIDGWRRPKPEYWDMKKVFSPIHITTKSLQPSRKLVVDVENRYIYTDLSEVKIDWRYGKETGTATIHAAPKQSAKLSIDIAQPEGANELYLSFTDPRGFIADEYVIPVGEQKQNELVALPKISTSLKANNQFYTITGKNFSCMINRIDGQIISMKKNNKEIINGGPWLMALPLNGGGCFPNHNADTPLFNDLCANWKLKTIDAQKEGDDIRITAKGSYNEFDGEYSLIINANGEFTAEYSFNSLVDVNPRQWGLVFAAPKSMDKTFWRRDAMWTVYPDDHISRPVGEANLFYEGLPAEVNNRVEPTWSWSYDFNELGSSDFRSTRRDIWYAGLKGNDTKLTAASDGKQSWRSWLAGEKIRFLIADFVTPGNEMFLGSYYSSLRRPIKVGDNISGKVTLRIE